MGDEPMNKPTTKTQERKTGKKERIKALLTNMRATQAQPTVDLLAFD